MNNNTSSVNPNSAPSSSSSKSVPKVNGTDNSNFRPNNSTRGINSINPEHPCNTCQQRSSSSETQNQSPVAPQHLFQNFNANNVGDGGLQANAVLPNLSATDDEDCEDSDDQYCVYFYKGDGTSQQPQRLAADLPSSFFKLHPSDSSSCPPSTSSSEIPSLEPSSSSSRCCHSSIVPNGSIHNPPVVNVNQNNNAMYSPDMDFLEMDFDPGGGGDGCCDGDDEDEEEDVVRDHLYLGGAASIASSSGANLTNRNIGNAAIAGPSSSTGHISGNQVLNDDQASAAVVLSKLVVTRTNGGGECVSSSEPIVTDVASDPVAHCSKRINNLSERVFGSSSSGQSTAPNNPVTNSLGGNDEIKLRLVKSVTLPEMGSSSGSTGGCCSNVSCNSNSNTRAMAMSISAPVFQDKLEGPCPTVIPAGKSSENSMELEVDGAMLWSVQEAREISINQIGKSACGATACLNVLSALGCIMTTLSPEFVNNCVGTRLRAEDADLPEYLLSRSSAGTTHEDLIAGINRASNGLIYGRFFQIRQNTSPSTLHKWLLHWICKGAVPIATMNLQIRRPGENPCEIPDAWHHQMIFGITRTGIYMTNPFECVPAADLIPQLSSPSVLLVRRDDVTSRKGPRTDLRKLARFPDPRWNEMNVLGQVSNMLLEEMPVLNGSAGLARRIRTPHISIPAAYKAGITLFVRESNTKSCALLKAAPEF